MECKWRPHQRSAAHRRPANNNINGDILPEQDMLSPATDTSPGDPSFPTAHAVDEVFDYASFMWDQGGDFWQQVSPGMNQNPGLETHMLVRTKGTSIRK